MRIFGREFGRTKQEPITYLGNLAKLDIKDGDTCVLMIPGHVDSHKAILLRDLLVANLGGNVKCFVLSDGMTIGVVHREAAGK